VSLSRAMFAPVPAIVVGDAVSPFKRRRLDPPTLDDLADAQVVAPLELVSEDDLRTICTGVNSPRQLHDNTIVCFGMVSRPSLLRRLGSAHAS